MTTIKQCIATLVLLVMGVSTVLAAPVATPQNLPTDAPNITAPSAVVMDMATGIVVYEKQKDKKSYPASTTKIMTALLSIEATDKKGSLADQVPFSHESVFSLPYGSSNIAMNEGETLTVNDALHALLLASANEVANALAEHIGGSNEKFAALMNDRAKALSATNTHFVNPHGLQDENHYTTAYDMALLTRKALAYPLFQKIIATTNYTIAPTELQKEPRMLSNSHKMIQPASPYYNQEVVGGKTGYTSQAKHTLVTYAKRGEIGLIVVVMQDDKTAAYVDTLALQNYGFDQFETMTIFDKTTYQNQLPIVDTKTNGTVGTVDIAPSNSVAMVLPKIVKAHTTTTLDLPKSSTRSVVEGQKLGKLTISYQNNVLAHVGLFAANSVYLPQPVIAPNLMQIGLPFGLTLWQIGQICLALLFVCLLLLCLLQMNRKRRRTARFGLCPAKKMTYGYKKTGRS